MSKLNYYLNLLTMNYDELVAFLLEKYGPSAADYYSRTSYDRFLKGEIKNISKGKTSRTSEGLYCHHIDENKYENLSNESYILNQDVPFSSQTKDKLVYCDLIEHAILHALITKETKGRFGEQGLMAFIIPMIDEWYVNKQIPSPQWMKNCYDKAFLEDVEAKIIIMEIFNFLEIV